MRLWSSGALPSLELTSRILDYVLYLLQYNDYLTRYYAELPPLYSSIEDRELMSRLNIRNLTCEQTFIDFVEYLYPKLLDRISLNGKIIYKATPPREITGYDETWPQHYSFPSAALDWTLSVPIALHFAIRGLHAVQSSGTTQLSICCYKQIIEEHSPVRIIEKSTLKRNERAIRQEGLFTYFTDPCNFFMHYGSFPSIELYAIYNAYFIVIKRNIEINKQNLEVFKKYTTLHGIDDKFLLLDGEYNLSSAFCKTESEILINV